MYNIYISCSNDMLSTAPMVKNLFKGCKGVDVKHHVKGASYKKEHLQQADAVIFILPNLNWMWCLDKLTKGLLGELIYCLNTRRPTFIAYKGSDGDIGIYPAVITDDLCISGIAGCKDTIFTVIESNLLPPKLSSMTECSAPSGELTNFETTY